MQGVLRTDKFIKTLKCKTLDETIVVKVYVKSAEDSRVDLSQHETRLKSLLTTFNLKEHPNVSRQVIYTITTHFLTNNFYIINNITLYVCSSYVPCVCLASDHWM